MSCEFSKTIEQFNKITGPVQHQRLGLGVHLRENVEYTLHMQNQLDKQVYIYTSIAHLTHVVTTGHTV